MKNWIIKQLPGLVKVKDGYTVTNSGYPLGKFLLHPARSIWKRIWSIDDRKLPIVIDKHTLALASRNPEVASRRANKYVIKIISKLHRYAINLDAEKFNKLAMIVSKRSLIFRLIFFDLALKSWGKLPDHAFKRIWKSTDSIIQKGKSNFEFRRIYIPKPDGTMRPLAVPAKPWRVVTKMYLMWFEIWIHPREDLAFSEYQFGGRRGSSTKDAWNHIWKNLYEKPYMAEFDLTKCFDSIYHWAVAERLIAMATPRFLWNFIAGVLSTSRRNLPDDVSAAEDEAILKENEIDFTPMRVREMGFVNRMLHGLWGSSPGNDMLLDEMRKERLWNAVVIQNRKNRRNPQALHPISMPHCKFRPGTNINELDPKQWPRINRGHLTSLMKFAKANRVPKGADKSGGVWSNFRMMLVKEEIIRGLPQGWGFSPILTNLVLKGTLPSPGVLYLDDGVVAADNLGALKLADLMSNMRTLGLSLKPAKFFWIKWDGEWLKPLKFLGLSSDENWNVSAATRSGASASLSIPSLATAARMASGKSDLSRKELKMPIDGAQIAYLYRDGRTWDENGKEIPIDEKELWRRSWKSAEMKAWRKEYPDKAALVGMTNLLEPQNSSKRVQMYEQANWAKGLKVRKSK